ncbi:MAG: class I SAM-dependent methyltransferase [Fodinibius sp.]|nr:class I SAM-dependent methyltransferase [Fodinibius sp.]
MPPEHCILCDATDIIHFYEDTSETYASDYFQCQRCKLIFAPPKDQPAPEDEFARYQTHENDPADEGYRNFLSQLFNPLEAKLAAGSKGLDFGSGPGPTLNIMFEEAGHQMNIYDPFMMMTRLFFDEQYDFITATEVVEHLFAPGAELKRLWNCLRPSGYLGIMTKIARDDRAHFADWHYRLDLTHVTFYTQDTFEWLAGHWNASVEFPGDPRDYFSKTELTKTTGRRWDGRYIF